MDATSVRPLRNPRIFGSRVLVTDCRVSENAHVTWLVQDMPLPACPPDHISLKPPLQRLQSQRNSRVFVLHRIRNDYVQLRAPPTRKASAKRPAISRRLQHCRNVLCTQLVERHRKIRRRSHVPENRSRKLKNPIVNQVPHPRCNETNALRITQPALAIRGKPEQLLVADSKLFQMKRSTARRLKDRPQRLEQPRPIRGRIQREMNPQEAAGHVSAFLGHSLGRRLSGNDDSPLLPTP